MKYASNNIRNILIAGHAGSGKTTLTEALVYFSGAAERMGRVEDGTTISDFDPEEAKRKASLSASVVPVEYEGIKYNLIDAPGLFDFEAGEYEGASAPPRACWWWCPAAAASPWVPKKPSSWPARTTRPLWSLFPSATWRTPTTSRSWRT